jgi:hypothetical protein
VLNKAIATLAAIKQQLMLPVDMGSSFGARIYSLRVYIANRNRTVAKTRLYGLSLILHTSSLLLTGLTPTTSFAPRPSLPAKHFGPSNRIAAGW